MNKRFSNLTALKTFTVKEIEKVFLENLKSEQCIFLWHVCVGLLSSRYCTHTHTHTMCSSTTKSENRVLTISGEKRDSLSHHKTEHNAQIDASRVCVCVRECEMMFVCVCVMMFVCVHICKCECVCLCVFKTKKEFKWKFDA